MTSVPTRPPLPRPLLYWYGAMTAGGLAFGLLGERRPLGDDVLAHPLVLFFVAAGLGLMAVRIALARPVPEVIPERALVFGCCAGLAAFLIGNAIAVHVLAS
jgi:hypothetical protein